MKYKDVLHTVSYLNSVVEMWVWLNYVSGACYLQSSLVKVWYVMCLWQNFDILLLWWMWMFVSWAWVAHRSWSFALNSTLNGINKEDYLKIHQSTYFLRKCLYIKKINQISISAPYSSSEFVICHCGLKETIWWTELDESHLFDGVELDRILRCLKS